MGIFGRWYLLASQKFWQNLVRLYYYSFDETNIKLITIWKARKVHQARMGDSHRSESSEKRALC